MHGSSGGELLTAFSVEPDFGDDAALIPRIIDAYRYAAAKFEGHGNSMWASISERSSELHHKLLCGDIADVTAQLRYPATHDLLSGFDEAARSIYSAHKAGDHASREAWGTGVHRRLVRLAEAVGAIPVWLQSCGRHDDRDLTVDGLLARLDATFGFRIDFPNPDAHCRRNRSWHGSDRLLRSSSRYGLHDHRFATRHRRASLLLGAVTRP